MRKREEAKRERERFGEGGRNEMPRRKRGIKRMEEERLRGT